MQVATFGRRLDGAQDELPGYEPSLVAIDDPQVAATLGRTHHANATFTGRAESRVTGMAFEVADAEIAGVDTYEAAFHYTRIVVTLASGRQAWVYVHQTAYPK